VGIEVQQVPQVQHVALAGAVIDETEEADASGGGGWLYWIEEASVEGLSGSRGGAGGAHASRELVSWAVQDEAGGVGLVYTVEAWRRMGLGRWALARLLDAMHGDWQERRVTSPPLSIVADADAIAIRMLEGLGFVRAAALYQLQVGGNEMMEPRYPESMPRIKVQPHDTSPPCLIYMYMYICICKYIHM
jgi:GNAT superfamily N-acetyltransferase